MATLSPFRRFAARASRIPARLWAPRRATRGSAFYLVVPSHRKHEGTGGLSVSAEQLLAAIRNLAVSAVGDDVRMLTIDSDSGAMRWFPENVSVSVGELFVGPEVIIVANLAFLLQPQQPFAPLLEAAQKGILALQGSDSRRALYAVAAKRRLAERAEFTRAISQLAQCAGTPPARPWSGQPSVALVQPQTGCIDYAPSASAVSEPEARPSPIAPAYLNTLLFEILYEARDPERADSCREGLRQALLAQRPRSAVPWLLNTLINEIEYRSGSTVLDSLPPEVHLSVTGRCNLECKFCEYSHDTAITDYVDVERVARLDFLRYSHTVRLSSGLGEPTLNPHLPRIIDYLAEQFPAIAINFFTNGLTLNRRALLDAMVSRATWINVSLNAATRATWKELCQRDMFDRVVASLQDLGQAKRERHALQPIVYGSMVLTSKNLHELPRMPELCRSLGVDRFTGIPFYAYGYDFPNRYGAAETFHHCRDVYERLYWDTIREARDHRVSIEIPVPVREKQCSFGLEVRSFYDFAGIDEAPGYLGRLVDGLDYEPTERARCPEIWRMAYIGSTDRTQVSSVPHYLYPCLGPLASVDHSVHTTYDLSGTDELLRIWNGPLFARLRMAQQRAGLSRVCDACRTMDSRDPGSFAELAGLLQEWEPPPSVPLLQIDRKRPNQSLVRTQVKLTA